MPYCEEGESSCQKAASCLGEHLLPSTFVLVPCSLFLHSLHRNYGVTAKDKDPASKRGVLPCFTSLKFYFQLCSLVLHPLHGISLPAWDFCRNEQGAAGSWQAQGALFLHIPFPLGLTCSEGILPKRCFRALKSCSTGFSPSWMLRISFHRHLPVFFVGKYELGRRWLSSGYIGDMDGSEGNYILGDNPAVGQGLVFVILLQSFQSYSGEKLSRSLLCLSCFTWIFVTVILLFFFPIIDS